MLLSVAAIGSQFSAAVADNEGAGGLLEDIIHHKLPMRYAYSLILLVTVALTWETDVNGIIALSHWYLPATASLILYLEM